MRTYNEEYDESTYAVHEAYYDEEGNVNGWTTSIVPQGATVEELRSELSLMLTALDKPVLDSETGKEI